MASLRGPEYEQSRPRKDSGGGECRRVFMSVDADAFRAKLSKWGLSLSQWYILTTCQYGPKPYNFVVGDAIAESSGNTLGSAGPAELDKALQACLDQSWVRIIDGGAFEAIKAAVSLDSRLRPVYGLPRIGDVDFTVQGATRFQALYQGLVGKPLGLDETFHVDVDFGVQIYCPTLKPGKVEAAAYRALPEVGAVSDPVSLGSWCVYWWLTFPNGYRIDVEYRQRRAPPAERPEK
jgi:hypothetical protein